MEEIKQKYIEQYKLYHNDGWGDGVSYPAQHQHIVDLIKDTQSQTVLDFGCGKGKQYTQQGLHHDWGFMPSLYDPSIPEYENLPEEVFDGIYSTDVMEHIPEEVIPEVFDYIFSHATKFVFLGICTRPAVAVLPNGENAHCTVKPIEWWVDKIREHNTNDIYTHLKCYGNSNGYEVLNPEKNIRSSWTVYKNA